MSLNHKEFYNGGITFSDELNAYCLKRAYENFDELVNDEPNLVNRILDLNFAIIGKSMALKYKLGRPQWVTKLHLQYLK